MAFEAHIKHLEDGMRIVQTVEDHSFSVANKAATYSSNLNLEHVAKLIGMLHDIGKLTSDFSKYINDENEYRRGDIDHSYAGAKYIVEQLEDNIDASEKKRFENIDSILMAHVIVAHHGIKDWIDSDGVDKFKERIAKSDRYEEILRNFSEIISDESLGTLYEPAVSEIDSYIAGIVAFCKKNYKTNEEKNICCSFYIGLFERLLQSILVDADRTDTIEFSLGKSIEFNKSFFKWTKLKNNLEDVLHSFPVNKNTITLLRQDISNRCAEFANHEVGISKLIVPTGGGKTLASMRFAVNYCIKYNKDRIFYIAPFMSILEQNSEILRKIAGDENFLEHHSNIIFGEDEDERITEYEMRTDQWDVPVIATTVVQFLNSIFSSKMDSVRRFHQLTNSVIILDEAQSIPDKCIYLFNMAMNFLAHFCKSSVILCTATQPTLENVKYPLIFDANPYSSMTGEHFSEDFEKVKRNKIVVQDKIKIYDNKEAADFCLERFNEEGSVLFIVNTKKVASQIFKFVKEETNHLGIKVVHISTNMCPSHRKEKIQEVRKLLKEKIPVICITTQLIEAGVDISFPCVIRSWAGLDNVMQAAGRCNRNDEIDHLCNVYLLRLGEENLNHLTEIRTAQIAMDRVLSLHSGNELFQTEIVEKYFKEYFIEQEAELSFKIKDGLTDSSILKLLSDNEGRVGQLKKKEHRYNNQAFKTAGTKFKVIEQNTYDILVPYNNMAREIIADFYSLSDYQNPRKLLKDSQQYVVSIYENMKKELEKNRGLEQVKIGNSEDYVLILKPGFYNNDYGINPEGETDNSLLFM